MRRMAVVHRRECELLPYLYRRAEWNIEPPVRRRVVQAEVGRYRMVPYLLREGDIVSLPSLRRSDAVRACAEDDGGPGIRFRQGEPVRDRIYLADGGIQLNTRLKLGRDAVGQSGPPLGTVYSALGVNVALTKLPL